MEANLPILISIPANACTNRKKAMEIPKRRWMVRTLTEFILLSLILLRSRIISGLDVLGKDCNQRPRDCSPDGVWVRMKLACHGEANAYSVTIIVPFIPSWPLPQKLSQ